MQAHRARKRFGQNFLHDRSVIERILRAINAQPADNIVEIGPGLGALSAPLLDRLETLHVVELDRDVIPRLRVACHDSAALMVHEADALRFDFRPLADKGPLRVVGNLPYNISTPLIFHLLDQAPVIHDMHFMLQKEVVDRITASPGNKDYGRLSVMVQYRCKAEKLFTVGPGAFRPAPKVDSAIVRLTPYATPPVEVTDKDVFAQVVARAFNQRRKTLRRTFKSL
ncbi:MAG: 16S rRNA (adenine(1518)-N(6)/adenine(1519)-N(6))-dimethyltransferase RsmA, partial [Gammaproteobacteria bacterium]